MITRTRYETLNSLQITLITIAIFIIYGFSFSKKTEDILLSSKESAIDQIWEEKTENLINSLSPDTSMSKYKQIFTNLIIQRKNSNAIPLVEQSKLYFIIEEYNSKSLGYKKTILYYKNDSSSAFTYSYYLNHKDSNDVCCFNYLGTYESFSFQQARPYNKIYQNFYGSAKFESQAYGNPIYVPFYYKRRKPSEKEKDQLIKQINEQVKNTYYVYSLIDLDKNDVQVYFRIPPESCSVKIYPSKTRT